MDPSELYKGVDTLKGLIIQDYLLNQVSPSDFMEKPVGKSSILQAFGVSPDDTAKIVDGLHIKLKSIGEAYLAYRVRQKASGTAPGPTVTPAPTPTQQAQTPASTPTNISSNAKLAVKAEVFRQFISDGSIAILTGHQYWKVIATRFGITEADAQAYIAEANGEYEALGKIYKRLNP